MNTRRAADRLAARTRVIGAMTTRLGTVSSPRRAGVNRVVVSMSVVMSVVRHYHDGDVDRVRLLQRLYDAGLSSRTIADLLPCVDAPSSETSDDAYARLVEERDRLDAHIGNLSRTRDSLDDLIATNRRTWSRSLQRQA